MLLPVFPGSGNIRGMRFNLGEQNGYCGVGIEVIEDIASRRYRNLLLLQIRSKTM